MIRPLPIPFPRRRQEFSEGDAPGGRLKRRIVLAGAASLVAWGLLQWVSPPTGIAWSNPMKEAAVDMAHGIQSVARHCREAGISIDGTLDPNGTCLIGPEYTPLFTTLGQLEAKRTSLNPDIAGLLVHLLERAGVAADDTVAIGASGSFPGLLLATLSAVKALGAHPVTILSLGASSYGATRPEMHVLDFYDLFQDAGLVTEPPAAVSLGGEEDVGLEFSVGEREELRTAVARAGVPLLEERGLRANVARRMRIYGDPGAFVNVGGGEANLGTSPEILKLPPGLFPSTRPLSGFDMPPPPERGVLFEMVRRGVPVIHLLHVRGLSLRYGVYWDPVPLPEPGSTLLREGEPGLDGNFWLLTAAYLGTLALLGVTARRRPSPPGRL
jgi:poly-gamma-glutamate system protein